MGLILASSSPRRKRILEDLGYNFECISPNIDESNSSNLKPIDYVVDVSERKGSHVWNSNQGSYVLSGCLLYTSPSPRDATLSRMPSSA